MDCKNPMRIALLTLEASAAAAAVRRFVAESEDEIALVGLSDPFGGRRGGSFRQFTDNMRVSGPRFIPYLAANFIIPRICGALWRRLRWPVDVTRMPLPEACRRRGIPCITVRDVNGSDWAAWMARSGIDLIITFHFDQILNAKTIAAATMGGVNVHAALLPHHRGPVPTIHALLDEQPVFGVTVHRLVPRIDAGAILGQAELPLPPDRVSALAAARLLHERGAALLRDVLTTLRQGKPNESPQYVLPYCRFPTPAQLRDLSRRGRSAAGWSDLMAAAALPV
jgi:folate-dependent phosphoribosylglycinamide formyltransferase PurN